MRTRRSGELGFTLVELLVVLALMGLMVGLAVPFGIRALDNSARRGAAADLGARLATYPVAAYHAAQAINVDAPQLRAAMPALPDDCRLALAQSLRYDASGMASGGRVTLRCEDAPAWVYHVAPLTGEVRLEPR